MSGVSPCTSIALVIKSGTHQARAPTENATQVKPRDTQTKDGLKIKNISVHPEATICNENVKKQVGARKDDANKYKINYGLSAYSLKFKLWDTSN